MKYVFKFSVIIFICIGVFYCYSGDVCLADYVIIDTSLPNTGYTSSYAGQMFRATTTDISAFGLWLSQQVGNGYFEMIVCKTGDNNIRSSFSGLTTGAYPNYRLICRAASGDTLIGSSSAIYGNSISPSETKINISPPGTLTPNWWYYWLAIPQPQSSSTVNKAIWTTFNVDVASNTSAIANPTVDWNYKLYSNFPANVETFILLEKPGNGTTKTPCDFTLWQTIYQLSSSTINTYENYDLYIDINYRNLTTKIDYQSTQTGLAKFIGEINNQNFLWGVPYFMSWTNPLEMPKSLGNYAATTTLWAHNAITGTNYTLSSYSSTFKLATSSNCAMDFLTPTGWCENICADIATSTFINDILCAGRMTLCYMFVPHSFTYNYFSDGITLYKNAFPFNTIFQLSNTITNTISSTTITTTDTIGIPFVRKQAGHANYYVLPVLASSSLPNAISGTNANLIRNTISYLIWILTVSLIIIIIWFYH